MDNVILQTSAVTCTLHLLFAKTLGATADELKAIVGSLRAVIHDSSKMTTLPH